MIRQFIILYDKFKLSNWKTVSEPHEEWILCGVTSHPDFRGIPL